MQDTQKAYVYILSNDRGNVLYIGCTEDLKKKNIPAQETSYCRLY